MKNKDSFWLNIIYIVSVVVILTVVFLILGPRPTNLHTYSIDVSMLPLINVTLNFTTTILLISALIFIKNKKKIKMKLTL